jgi:predicted ATPase/DNA-binding winged helix-turn-helix (wHTH) protein
MAAPLAASTEPAFSFGSFRLLPSRRLLFDGETPVRLGSRAFEILVALIERRGELVSKDELITRVWPNIHIAAGNLKFQIAGLRRALGDGRNGRRYIQASPGQGYRFVAAVTITNDAASDWQRPSLTNKHNLPVRLTRLIGRAGVVSKLLEQLPTLRLLTIVGAGGIGKTAVANAVAEELLPAYDHGVWLIDLAPIADPRLVTTALASVLRLEVRSVNPLPSLVAALKDKRMLLLLDNCEHVIEAAADLAFGILSGAPDVRILATSREPLRTPGEHVYRLLPLAVPAVSDGLTGAEALRFPAVQLFVERAAANVDAFELSEEDASSAGDICRKLDGIPLAIEFAAARVDAFGVRGLAARLDDRLRLSIASRRTALPRHRTISATLDWSYQLLSQEEQMVLQCLANFAGGFTLEAARAVTVGAVRSSLDIADTIAGLTHKSLIVADISDRDVRFRLLEITRAFVRAKHPENHEAYAIVRCHATFYRDLLESGSNSPLGEDFVAAHAPEIDNIRAALTWAFAPGGDRAIGVALAEGSAPIWLDMSLLTECLGWTGKALDLLDAADRGTRREMVLQTALGLSLMFTQGMNGTARAALARATELAESLENFSYQLRALAGLTTYYHRIEELQSALALSRQAEAIAKDIAEPAALSTTAAMLSASLFFLGDYSEALTHARRAYRRIIPTVTRGHIVRAGLDDSIWAGAVVAQSLWLQGLIDQSIPTARDVVADAEARCNPVSSCFALVWCGCSISLRIGALSTAEHLIARLKDHTERYDFRSYHAYSLGFEGQLFAGRGDIAAAEPLLRACLDGLRNAKFEIPYTVFLSVLADVLATAGRLDDSLSVADEALQRTQRNNVFWWMPEALRTKGEVLMLSDQTEEAENHFRRSLDLAHQQGAQSWELRSAMSLGRLQYAQGRVHDARDQLNSVYARFTEGFATADLRSARRFLEEWTSDKTCQGKC